MQVPAERYPAGGAVARDAAASRTSVGGASRGAHAWLSLLLLSSCCSFCPQSVGREAQSKPGGACACAASAAAAATMRHSAVAGDNLGAMAAPVGRGEGPQLQRVGRATHWAHKAHDSDLQ